jgi:hypothetical protein
MEFNSLDAQRDACEAYVASQRGEGWLPVQDRYDDGGVSGGTLERPASPTSGGSFVSRCSLPISSKPSSQATRCSRSSSTISCGDSRQNGISNSGS